MVQVEDNKLKRLFLQVFCKNGLFNWEIMNWKCRYLLWKEKRKQQKKYRKFLEDEINTVTQMIISRLAGGYKVEFGANNKKSIFEYKALEIASKRLGLQDFLEYDGNYVGLDIKLENDRIVKIKN